MAKKGRSFQCASCPKNIQKLRRCREDRWDFDESDASFFPMRIHEGGNLYGFCPGKATWDHEAVSLYKLLILSCEQKTQLVQGGLVDQPYWWIDTLAWFAPAFDMQKFMSKARMVLGDGSSAKQNSSAGKSRQRSTVGG